MPTSEDTTAAAAEMDRGVSVGKILFVSHEASRTGAPMFLLHFLRWLRRNTAQEFEVLLGRSGPLEPAFAAVATVHTPQAFATKPDLLRTFSLIYSNTACNGHLLEELPYGDIPIITHIHELDMGYHWLGARNMAAVIRQSNHYIACAEAVATRLRRVFNIPSERISVHYEMIDGYAVVGEAAQVDAMKLRRDYDLPEDAFIVVGCGTFDLRKAPDLFVQFAARLKHELGPDRPLRCLWIGAQNSPDLVRLVREDARKSGLEKELRFIGELPSPHGLILLSDIFCLTSREDPFPLVMLEAATLGKPVLCFSGAGGAGEFCAAGGGLPVPYLDVAAMAELARDLLHDPTRRAEIGGRAAGVVRERFVADVVAPALWGDVRQHLLCPAPPSPYRPPQISRADIYSTWMIEEAPQYAYVIAHLARTKVRHRARALVAEGRKAEAIQSLIRAASADVATKDPSIVFESLVEIGDDLAPLEPKQSAHLLAEAERIARGNSTFKVSAYRAREAASR